MQFSFRFFVVLFTTVVVGPVSVAAEPCANGWGEYDMTRCNFCAEQGKGHGECCEGLYKGSFGRDDDDDWQKYGCFGLNEGCKVGGGDCYPGLLCYAEANETCQKPSDPCANGCDGPNGTASLVTRSSSSLTSTTTMVVVGLLGAALLALQVVVQRRHRGGLLRRHQYSEVDATATRFYV